MSDYSIEGQFEIPITYNHSLFVLAVLIDFKKRTFYMYHRTI